MTILKSFEEVVQSSMSAASGTNDNCGENTDRMHQYLQKLGIQNIQSLHHNPSYALLREQELHKHAIAYEDGQLTQQGAVAVKTGQFTGRSPKDKYIVEDQLTRDSVWWHKSDGQVVNRAITTDTWQHLQGLAVNELCGKTLYVVDAYCGANKDTRLSVRFVMEVAWQAHFVKNMFIPVCEDEKDAFDPDFVVLNAAKAVNPQWQQQGLNSENFVAFNLSEGMQVIGGTWYGGEMKKGIFSVMNFLLPRRGVASMHAAANKGEEGDVAIFFGLSGTGKTTLSTDASRALIGDDEHGWDDDGVFNFEGGCYAKTINLKAEQEPEIYQAIRENALLENVVVNDACEVDYTDNSLTENTRVSYPINHITNIVKPVSKGGHASNILFLAADATGALPAVSKLDEAQLQYYFLSGYTSKIAGTERGIKAPQPTFSACFGEAFLMLHPMQYAEQLLKRVRAANSTAYLLNTGWNGKGQRMPLTLTRRLINAILAGELDTCEFASLPLFHLSFPTKINGVESSDLDPRSSFDSEDVWQQSAATLAAQFVENFRHFEDHKAARELISVGPSAAS